MIRKNLINRKKRGYRLNIQYNNIIILNSRKNEVYFFCQRDSTCCSFYSFCTIYIILFFTLLPGYNNEFRRHVHVYRRRRYSAPLLDWLSERKQIHQRGFRTCHRHHGGRAVRSFRCHLPGGHRTVVYTFRQRNGVRLRGATVDNLS